MVAKYIFPSFKILNVAIDTVDRISAQQLAQTSGVATLFQDIEGDTAFPVIVRLSDVALFEHDLKVINTKSEYALVGKSGRSFKIVE